MSEKYDIKKAYFEKQLAEDSYLNDLVLERAYPKGEIQRFWMVIQPEEDCELEEMIKEANFKTIFELYETGLKPENIYGVYVDNNRATNIAKRLLSRMRRHWLDNTHKLDTDLPDNEDEYSSGSDGSSLGDGGAGDGGGGGGE